MASRLAAAMRVGLGELRRSRGSPSAGASPPTTSRTASTMSRARLRVAAPEGARRAGRGRSRRRRRRAPPRVSSTTRSTSSPPAGKLTTVAIATGGSAQGARAPADELRPDADGRDRSALGHAPSRAERVDRPRRCRYPSRSVRSRQRQGALRECRDRPSRQSWSKLRDEGRGSGARRSSAAVRRRVLGLLVRRRGALDPSREIGDDRDRGDARCRSSAPGSPPARSTCRRDRAPSTRAMRISAGVSKLGPENQA